MKIFNYSVKNISEIADEFGTDLKVGLDSEAVGERFEKFGPNKLLIKEITGWHIFFRQFKSVFIYLLFGAMAITMFLGESVDTLMIFLFVTINTVLGFYQEYSSEKTAQLLNKYALPRARVLRCGKMNVVTADQLVPGDVIELETGDNVPADARIFEQENLIVDETILTGESMPISKKAEVLESEPSSYYEALNLVFSGTDVVKGKARALVLATGKQTEFGQIAKLVSESEKVSDFEKGISRFSQFILKLVGVTLLVVLAAHLLIKRDGVNALELVIFSVALTVSVIPEALPLVTTFSLARGAKRLAKKQVIVKRMSAIEDLGGIEILCSDKTGTLTENDLTIANIYSKNSDETIWLANLATSFEMENKTEPFDIALERGLGLQEKARIKNVIKLAEEPFDPKIKRNATLVNDGNKTFLIMRGAPETVTPSCSGIDGEENESIEKWLKKEGKQGRRVIAIGYKEISIADKEAFEQELEKTNFIFSGVISFADPIKPSAITAISEARQLGVRVIIITGDGPEVSGAVAYQIGMIDSPKKVITGSDWKNADEGLRKEYLEKNSVFARISPEEKFSIIKSLNEKYSVGFLGEGINDAPALKIAGVSLVVDSAIDIAREASDIILLKKNLTVVIDGIKEGRKVFANTTKYIKSTLASNFGNFFAVATASLMIDFLPMLPIQILLVNLLSDTPMISISTDTVDNAELQSPKKYEAKEIIIIAIVLGVVSTIFDFMFFSLFYNISPEVLQTNWFIGSILTELALLFSIRTKSFFIKTPRPSAPIIWLSLMTVIVTVGLPFSAFGQKVFKFIPPTVGQLALIFSLVGVYFIISETVKLMYYKSKNSNGRIKA